MSEDEDSNWLRSQLQNVLSSNGWSCEQWAKRAGIAPTTLTRFINKQTAHVPSTSTLLKLERAAGRPLLGATAGSAFEEAHQEAKARTREAGDYIKSLRERVQMSQRQFSIRLNIKHYGFVSQVETGSTYLPAEYWPPLCELCGEDIKKFTHFVFARYYPDLYNTLMDVEGQKHAVRS